MGSKDPSEKARVWRPKFKSLLCCLQSPSPMDSKLQDSASSCTHQSTDPNRNRRLYKHDVFLSFRGTDTRNNFIDHLYHNLIRKGVFAFKDNERLQKGESISSQLLQAIRDSRVSIIVFSRDYAASTWCLDEMATIAQCKKEFGQKVFSVFYDVDPSDVRKQSGVYGDAFASHTKRFQKDLSKVKRWKRAMTDLANSAGWDVRDKPQFTEIDKIIQKVIKELDHRFSGFADDLVGIQPCVKELEQVLKINPKDEDVRVLGIWGMGGIGKTTLASVLYDKISYMFDAHCFIENVSKSYREGSAISVQRQILRRTLEEQDLDKYSPSEIAGIIRNRLSSRKLLIVLDNVDEREQLDQLAINTKLLGRGSRIIITTRDKHILESYGIDAIHNVSLMNSQDASELLFRKAFKSDRPSSSTCMELTPIILEYAQGLPLAIKVVGSFLDKRNASQWRAYLERLKKYPDKKLTDVLQVSFEDLQNDDKEIFLHIACFFRGDREDYVKRILATCGLQPNIGIPVLEERSLITIKNQEIHMHDMLQELGKKLVRERYPEEPALWSRLWRCSDFENALMSAETGTNHVKAIVLDQREEMPGCSQLRIRGLSKLRDLKLLILYHKNFLGSLDFLSPNLQYLAWHGYPFPSLPSFQPYSRLVELSLPYSNVKRLWEGNKNIPHLEKMDLSYSKDLIETPNFEWNPNLKRLDFTGCTNLTHVHPSIGLLKQLGYLSLQNCSSLLNLNLGDDCNLSSLRVLRLSGCTNLGKTPDFTGLSNLEYLDFGHCTNLTTVHESIGALAMLKFLSLRSCRNIVDIPNEVNNMISLQTLDLRECKLLMSPLGQISMSSSYLGCLISLDLGSCNLIETIPDSIGDLSCLERLNLEGTVLRRLPGTIKKLSRLAYLNLACCDYLQGLHELPFDSAPSGGRYFQTVSASRNHRSGLYVVNKYNMLRMKLFDCMLAALSWFARLVEQPCHFRCGFDIIIPGNKSGGIPGWYFIHQFKAGSAVRVVDYDDADDNWLGVSFYVTSQYVLDNCTPPGQLRHHFYLSFESEHTEEHFDMPSIVEHHLHSVPGVTHAWIIYVSRVHCHFVKTGARIRFKACQGLKLQKWGFRMVFKQDIEELKRRLKSKDIKKHSPIFDSSRLVIETEYVDEDPSSSSESKIMLPYNWLVTDEEENEKMEAKAKEDDLSNLGLI
ncbi:TMV resistance protein N isoform X2 [Arachis ipaensis]|uniref:TMV resistance protein N isoform X2 n=1 Tax=Arachis ipaensis TaxID=130454 RepID=UPI0007AF9953|nr:TMV resistance protein N isoform X2 [Arachis ipaensis]XP_020964590.1 TMV resistance protein N isoform X2 [Arachis ipaensis]